MSKLSDILARLDSVAPDGDGFVARCPAHDDSHASLRVAVSEAGKALLKCRAGCSTEAVMAASGLAWKDLFSVEVDVAGAEQTNGGAGEVPVQDRARMAAYLTSCADRLQAEGHEAGEYLLRRFGVDLELASALGLGYDPGHGAETFPLLGAVHHSTPRVVVPFRDAHGVPQGFQSRDLTDTSKAKWAGPVNPEAGAWAKTAFFPSGSGVDFLVVTEGPGDGLTSAAAGVDSVAIRGAALGKGVAEGLTVALRGRRVVLAGDGDKAGSSFNEDLGTALGAAGLDVRVLALPEGVGDLSEWYEADRSGFSEAFQAAVFRAPAFVTEGAPPPEPEELELDVTDVGVARLVVEFFSGRLAYTPGLGFFIYEGGTWARDTLNRTRATIYEVSDHFAARAVEEKGDRSLEGDARAKLYVQASKRLRASKVIDQVMKELQTMTAVGLERYDTHKDLLAVSNGVVNLRTGELGPHDKDLYLTQRVDVDFRPEAQCPRWEGFLREVFPADPGGLPPYIQRLVGYGITGETAEQCFAVLWGRGANGKSVFTDTLTHVFRGITQTTPFSTFEEKQSGGIPNDLAALRGSRLVFASEGERGKPMAEAVIKRVTGQDLITARFMREEFFSFEPTFLIMLATNHKPAFRSADEGLWRRVKMIPWKRYFAETERDHYLTEKLRAESEGILAWSVAGAVSWYRHGLGDPSMVVEATKGYRDTSDALSGFFPEVLRPEEGAYVLGSDAYRAYTDWTDREELPAKEVWSRRALYAAMEERGVERVKRNVGQVLLGVTLDAPAPEKVLPVPDAPEGDPFGGVR